jgi:hypothetical protein
MWGMYKYVLLYITGKFLFRSCMQSDTLFKIISHKLSKNAVNKKTATRCEPYKIRVSRDLA